MSEQGKHTPGPKLVVTQPGRWISCGAGISGVRFTREVPPFGRDLAMGYRCSTEELRVPNAIASAAPDLLEAAIWCKALCKETGATATNAYAAACAALAKVEVGT